MVFWQRTRICIPVALSLYRIAAAPALIILYIHRLHAIFLLIAVTAALTDFWDGRLARRWRCATQGGAVLDIIGDKFFCGIFIALIVSTKNDWRYLAPLGLLATYHIAVLMWRGLDKGEFRSSVVAKVKTCVEMTAFIVAFASFEIGERYGVGVESFIGFPMLWMAGVLACYSIAHYFDFVPDIVLPGVSSRQITGSAPPS